MERFLKKPLLAIAIFALSVVAYAKLPTLPSSCDLRTKTFCSQNDVVRVNGKKTIKVKIVASFKKPQFSTPSALTDRYFDFVKWPDYVSGSRNISFKSSEALFARVGPEERKRHKTSYTIRAPFPVRRLNVVDIIEYTEYVEPGAVISATFKSIPSFSGRKGVKDNWGEIHVLDKGDKYVVLFENNIVPDISIGLSLAAPIVEEAMEDVFKGMFEL